MKFLKKLYELDEQRPFLKLYYDDSLTVITINRVLDVREKSVKELQDIVKTLRASDAITHFSCSGTGQNLLRLSL